MAFSPLATVGNSFSSPFLVDPTLLFVQNLDLVFWEELVDAFSFFFVGGNGIANEAEPLEFRQVAHTIG
jgi:hypothetical protein